MPIMNYYSVQADVPKTVGTGTAARTYMEKDTIGVVAGTAAEAIAKVLAACPGAVVDSVARDSSVICDAPATAPAVVPRA